MEKKPWYTSKTLWVNALALGAHAGKIYLGIDAIPEPDPVLVLAANIALRLVTKKQVTL